MSWIYIHKSALAGNYLGLPLIIPRSKRAAFHDIKDSIYS